jgi:hypothetical protein
MPREHHVSTRAKRIVFGDDRKCADTTKDKKRVDIGVIEANANDRTLRKSRITMSNDNENKIGTGTRAVSFRISESVHQDFIDLLGGVPGSDAGSMYREIFSRGLKSVTAFYEQQGIVGNDGSAEKEGA